MKQKQLVYLFCVAIVVVVIGLVIQKRRAQAWEGAADEAAALVVPDLPLNDIEKIEVEGAGGKVVVVRQEGRWRVSERYGYPAKFDKISEFLRDLAELRAAQTLRVGPSQYGRLELAPPDADQGAGTRVVFYAADEKKIGSLILGKKHERVESGSGSQGAMGFMGGGGSWPDGRYLLVPEAQKVVLVSETFSAIEPDAEDWVDKEFFKIGEVRQVRLVEGGNTVWELTREDKSAEMTLAGLKEDEEQDDTKVRSIKNAFSWASFADIADPGLTPADTGLDQPKTYTAEEFDGFVYTVNIGKKTDDGQYYLTADVEYNPVEERQVEEGETEEDKVRKDAEFKKTLEENKKKFKEIKDRLGGWVYLVSSSTVDSVLKERQELIKEKPKEEEEKDEGKKDADAAAEGKAPAETE